MASVRFLMFLLFIFQTSLLYAIEGVGTKYNSRTGAKDFCLKISNTAGTVVNDTCAEIEVTAGLSESGGNFVLATGGTEDGAVSYTSSQTAISTSYSFVRKAITSDPAFQNGTLANGVAGQLLTIKITEAQNNSRFVLTPATKTGFTALIFEAVGDLATLLYIGDVTGWIVISQESVQTSP